MLVRVYSITYGGKNVDSKSVKEKLEAAIRGSLEFEITDSNLNSGRSSTPQKCTIEYVKGDDVRKRRTLETGQTFRFANDIKWIKFPEKELIASLEAFEYIFQYMDTANGFTVNPKDFGISSGGRDPHRLNLRYHFWKKRDELRDIHTTEGRFLDFDKGGYVKDDGNNPYPPNLDPPKPAVCQCPCPMCKLNHQTDEQRKAEQEKKEREEKERRQELDRLKKAIEEARDLAEKANTRSQDTQQQVENLKEALNDLRKVAEQASKDAENAGKEAQEAKRNSNQNRTELEKTRKELEVLKAQLAELLDRGSDVRLPETPAIIKVCFFGSQLLAVVILVTFAVKQVRGER